MCLEVNSDLTTKLSFLDEIKVYKVLDKDNISIYKFFQYVVGENIAEKQEKLKTKIFEIEEGALHVYLDKRDAKEYIKSKHKEFWKDYKVVELIGKKEDFVAAGFFCDVKSACFTKLYMESDKDVFNS